MEGPKKQDFWQKTANSKITEKNFKNPSMSVSLSKIGPNFRKQIDYVST